mmetsp:Transcript_36572/g.100946  ORF Transcript_36572/g.100946 Transcript_36572/m.100946 type:complete len:447 (+) Transcript_36572:1798-3138(+)
MGQAAAPAAPQRPGLAGATVAAAGGVTSASMMPPGAAKGAVIGTTVGVPAFSIARTFRCEYEFGFPSIAGNEDQIATELRRLSGEMCVRERFNEPQHVPDFWKLRSPDRSVMVPNHTTLELISAPLRGQEGLNKLTRMLESVERLNPQVNTTTSHRIHIKASDMTLDELKKVCVAFVANEKVFDLLTARSRQGNQNTTCKSNQHEVERSAGSLTAALNRLQQAPSLEALVELVNPRRDPYFKLNLTIPGWLEFRLHQGTFEAQKSRNFVELLQRFVHHVKREPKFELAPPPQAPPAKLWLSLMFRMINRQHLTKYFWQRIVELDDIPVGRPPRIVRVSTDERKAVNERGFEVLNLFDGKADAPARPQEVDVARRPNSARVPRAKALPAEQLGPTPSPRAQPSARQGPKAVPLGPMDSLQPLRSSRSTLPGVGRQSGSAARLLPRGR